MIFEEEILVSRNRAASKTRRVDVLRVCEVFLMCIRDM